MPQGAEIPWHEICERHFRWKLPKHIQRSKSVDIGVRANKCLLRAVWCQCRVHAGLAGGGGPGRAGGSCSIPARANKRTAYPQGHLLISSVYSSC